MSNMGVSKTMSSGPSPQGLIDIDCPRIHYDYDYDEEVKISIN